VLRGTAGALRHAFDSGLLPKEFLVLNGDSYLRISLAAVETAWRASGLPALMTVFRNLDKWDISNASFDGEHVRYRKGGRQGETVEWIDYGLSALTSNVVESYVPAGGHFDLADVFAVLSEEGLLAGYPAQRRFYEVGSPSGLADLEELLSQPRTD